MVEVVGSGSRKDGFGGALIKGTFMACGSDFGLLGDGQCAAAVVTSSVGVQGHWWPPWRGCGMTQVGVVDHLGVVRGAARVGSGILGGGRVASLTSPSARYGVSPEAC
jgi:hypothetical protein